MPISKRNFLPIAVALCMSVTACGNPRDQYKESIVMAQSLARQGKADAAVREFRHALKHAHTINRRLYKVDWPYSGIIQSLDQADIPAEKKLPVLLEIYEFAGGRSYEHNTPTEIIAAMVPAIQHLDLSFGEKFEIFFSGMQGGERFNPASLEIMFEIIAQSDLNTPMRSAFFDKVFTPAWNGFRPPEPDKRPTAFWGESDKLYLRVLAMSVARAGYLDPDKRRSLAFNLLDISQSNNGDLFSSVSRILLHGAYEKPLKLELYDRALVLACQNRKEWGRRPAHDVFNVYIKDEMVGISGLKLPEQFSDRAMIKGKLLPIEVHTREDKSGDLRTEYEIDRAFFWGLPEELLASKTAEVNTLALFAYRKVHVGQYTSGGPAYKTDIEMQIVDFGTPRTVYRKTFYGRDEPPGMITVVGNQKGEGAGSAPYAEVIAYLTALWNTGHSLQ